MNISKITVQDCIDMWVMKEKRAVLENGGLKCFENEKSTVTDVESEQC